MEMKKISKIAWVVAVTLVVLYFALPEAWYHFKTSGIDRRNLTHDDFLTLVKYGREKDVEPLIAYLQRIDSGPAQPGEKRIYPCIYIHCVDALKAITGVDHGMSREGWAHWFRQTYGRAVEIDIYADKKP